MLIRRPSPQPPVARRPPSSRPAPKSPSAPRPEADTYRAALTRLALRQRLQTAQPALRSALLRHKLSGVGSQATAVLTRMQQDEARLARLQPETRPWRVEWGQTLTGIATTLQSQGVQGTIPEIIQDICARNGIENPDLIYAGSTLQVPTASNGAPAAPLPQPEPSPSAPAPAPGASPNEGGYDVPYISQMSSEGSEDDWNASSNCGPTSMAMIARAFGLGDGMSDGTLVNSLGRSAGVGSAGVGYAGMMTMAGSLGLETSSNPGSDVRWIEQQLAQGNLVAANGNRSVTLQNESPPGASGSASGGHWIVVTGMTPDGNFRVQDPSTTCRVLTPSELSRFLAANSHGGYAVSVSQP